MKKGLRDTLHTENLWLHDEMSSTGPRIFALDFPEYYSAPAPILPDTTRQNLDDPIVVGTFTSDSGTSHNGPLSEPAGNTWPEGELLPLTLTGAALPATGATRATFKVVRAASEVDRIGHYADAYDRAIVSLGPCHWTLGIVNDATHKVGDGELSAFLSFVRAQDAASFTTAVELYGARASKDWGSDGRSLFSPSVRTFHAWMALHDDAGAFIKVSDDEAEGNYFKTWQWFYRFQMAGRTIAGFQRQMWNMARMRLRGIFDAKWGPGVANAGVTVAAPTGRAPLVSDVYTSEKAASS